MLIAHTTPHNSAPRGSVSKLVIVTGDPLRCKKFAELYLQPHKLLSQVRNVYCYTGTYRGVEITIMAHGMGQGSMGIYTYELFAKEIYDADLVIRLGSCGAVSEKVKLNDLVVVERVHTNSNYGALLDINPKGDLSPDPKLLELVYSVAKEQGLSLKGVRNFSSDNFYTKYKPKELGKKVGCDTVEMESYALAVNAQYHQKKFLTILTVVDEEMEDGRIEELHWKEREEGLGNMFVIGLETLVKYAQLNNLV